MQILQDSCSQRSYITSHFKEKLKLHPLRKETLSLITFGDEKIRARRCDEDQVKLKILSKTIEINTLSFPKICAPLPLQLDVKFYSHLDGLEIADASFVADS